MLSKVIVLSLAVAASAMPARSHPKFAGPVAMMAIRSASPIHYGQINAAGENFYIGVEPSSYCPVEEVGKACPSGNVTAIGVSSGGFSMDVMVPGGQQGFVRVDGSLGYTQAHSASQPEGSKPGGFSLGKKQANTIRWLTADGQFLACPKTAGVAPYQIFLDVPGLVAPSGSKADCLSFENAAIEFTSEEFGAWQY